jgi:hypothetical protein
MDVDDFVTLCAHTPAIHRFPASMGRRIHALCSQLVEDYAGDAAAVWNGATDAKDLRERLRALPGYGAEKTKIFIAILAKRMGVRLDGWEQVAAPFSDDQPRSVADVASPETLLKVREWKKAMKAAKSPSRLTGRPTDCRTGRAADQDPASARLGTAASICWRASQPRSTAIAAGRDAARDRPGINRNSADPCAAASARRRPEGQIVARRAAPAAARRARRIRPGAPS